MKKLKKLLILIIFIIISSYFAVIIIGKSQNPKILKYANVETKRLAVSIINASVNEVVDKSSIENDLLTLTKNNNNEIELIDFNTKNVNKMLKEVSENIQSKLLALEEGNVSNIDISDTLKGKNFPKKRKGIVCEIPAGSMFGNSLLANTGPIIPVKLAFIGKVFTSINTKIESYGINNAYLQINIEVEVTEKITLPTMTKEVKIKKKIPIAMKVIQGKIPEYYNNNLENSLGNYTLPID